MARLTAYLRVSTTTQAEDGLGLDIQEQATRKWCRANKHRLLEVRQDAGISGSNGLDTRIALADAIEDVRSGRSDGIIVYRLDRLARDLVLQEQLLAEVRRAGGDIYTTSAAEQQYLADDPNDPSRTLIRQVLGAVSQYERSMIRLRLAAGRRRKHERGGFAYGSPAYGTRAANGELVRDDQENAAIACIRRLHRQGKSLREIAEVLTAEGHKPRRSDRWHPQTIARIIRRFDRRAA